jgi:hypothetical protein
MLKVKSTVWACSEFWGFLSGLTFHIVREYDAFSFHFCLGARHYLSMSWMDSMVRYYKYMQPRRSTIHAQIGYLIKLH